MQTNSTSEHRHSRANAETVFVPQPETLRHLGFQTVILPKDAQRQSLGPSHFHQLGYCHRGRIILTTSGQPHVLKDLELHAGDFFYLPVGTQYTIANSCKDVAIVVLATARDGFDITASAERKNLVPPSSAERSTQIRVSEFPEAHEGIGYGTGDMDDDVPHVVLFFDQDIKWPAEPLSVAKLFPKNIISREFGVSSTMLPDLTVGVESPLVFRAIASENELAH